MVNVLGFQNDMRTLWGTASTKNTVRALLIGLFSLVSNACNPAQENAECFDGAQISLHNSENIKGKYATYGDSSCPGYCSSGSKINISRPGNYTICCMGNAIPTDDTGIWEFEVNKEIVYGNTTISLTLDDIKDIKEKYKNMEVTVPVHTISNGLKFNVGNNIKIDKVYIEGTYKSILYDGTLYEKNPQLKIDGKNINANDNKVDSHVVANSTDTVKVIIDAELYGNNGLLDHKELGCEIPKPVPGENYTIFIGKDGNGRYAYVGY